MSLPLMIKDLIRPSAYPLSAGKISLIQTHISFIILTDTLVYKIKKPVNFGFLDFSTIDKRRFYCQQELELNRRLSKDIYIDLLEIRQRDDHFFYDGGGEIVDYAIRMKRIPEDLMMINLLKQGRVDPLMLRAVAITIADFHLHADTTKAITAFGHPQMIRENIDENFRQIEKYIDKTLSIENYKIIKKYCEEFIKQNESLLIARMNAGKIKDCHGDIHMEHVCVADKIYIYDCIEFNNRFRYGDVASDVAFLAMDLDFHSERDLSESFIQSYQSASRDCGIKELIDFYKCYRACIRGKVNSFELDDPALTNEEKGDAAKIARRYFDLALSYAAK